MATDATGTPTAKGIPKYNTVTDAPSGKGFNAAMDAIDLLVGYTKARKNSGGSDFERGRLNLIEGSGITITMADDSGNNEIDVTIAASGSSSYVTALPGSPVDGQECILVDSTSAPTWSWHMRFNSTTGKWHFLGGTPGYSEVTADETSGTVGSYVALTTAGPSFAIPVAGDYDVEIGAQLHTSGAGGTVLNMSYDIGGTGAVDADATVTVQPSGSSPQPGQARVRRKTGLTAVTLTAKYKTSATQIGAQNRWMRVTPVKIG